ncbi:hypothetical protein QLQ12_01970 [Actinoplanes sp. NEAU-A12]|uniref:DUF2993 domain-containing protein n=1 Tax=Actinoplanes sandaracinus TaxID=3045177 RepID=A0ABT6WCD1_9ACTN|nr:hypothetical protein [Actinoplanes sandaracinus]MDI6097368.1 hypothetical protein [Actinoplanes sandaracinus]
MRRPSGRVMVGAAVVTVVLLVAAAGGAAWWRWDTQRQPRVDDVVTDMNTAVADAVAAAGEDAAVAVSPVVAAADCRLGPLRPGKIFTGKADLYTDPGGEDALITTIERNLPPRYAAGRGTAVAGVRPLQADIGTVTLSVRRLSPGWLAVTARSRCSLGAATEPAAPTGAAPGITAVTQLLAAAGTRPAGITEQRLRCTTGDIVTISAVSERTDTGDLTDRLAPALPSTARRFTTGDANRISYRDGPVSVIVASSDDGTAITAQHTTGC